MGGAMEPRVAEIVSAVWQNADVSQTVFSRWYQGFVFSADDPLVLLQHEGGPCAVIAPVQAHIFKHMLLTAADRWRQLCSVEAANLLCIALAEILERASSPAESAQLVVPHHPSPPSSPSSLTSSTTAPLSDSAAAAAAASEGAAAAATADAEGCAAPGGSCSELVKATSPRCNVSPDHFHASLRIVEVKCGQSLLDYITAHIDQYSSHSGVLLFLYSAIASRGVGRVRGELSDSEHCLVDRVHGHGSQALTNLLITGRAVAHVWDNTKHLAGMALEGILSQPEVGFLTVMERLHYCTVGWNLKNPLHPVWLLASETHLTVLFSPCRQLARPPSPRQQAARCFDQLDVDAAGFVPVDQLPQLFSSCQLVSEPEYVQLMRHSLDPEQLGVVLRSAFLDEFFPQCGGGGGGAGRCTPDSFTVYHCNSLPSSSADHKVKLRRGEACLLETIVDCTAIDEPLLTCLQSKWPRIDVRWEGPSPSVN